LKREIVVCDRCKKTAESPEERKALDLHEVILGTSRRYRSQYETGGVQTYAETPEWNKDWCLACRIETGLAVVMERKNGDNPVAVPTLEDMVREIVRDELPRQY